MQARAGAPFCGVLDALGPPCLTANVRYETEVLQRFQVRCCVWDPRGGGPSLFILHRGQLSQHSPFRHLSSCPAHSGWRHSSSPWHQAVPHRLVCVLWGLWPRIRPRFACRIHHLQHDFQRAAALVCMVRALLLHCRWHYRRDISNPAGAVDGEMTPFVSLERVHLAATDPHC